MTSTNQSASTSGKSILLFATLVCYLTLFSYHANSQDTEKNLKQATYYFQNQNYSKALEYAELVKPDVDRFFTENDPIRIGYENFLAACYRETAHYNQSAFYFDKCRVFYKNQFGTSDERFLNTSTGYLGVLVIAGRYREAEDGIITFLKLFDKDGSPSLKHYLVAKNHLGLMYSETERYIEAENIYKEILPLMKQNTGIDRDYVMSEYNLAFVYDHLGNSKKAVPLIQDGIRNLLLQYGENENGLLDLYNLYASIFLQENSLDSASLYFNKAIILLQTLNMDQSRLSVLVHNNQAQIYLKKKEYNKARQMLEENMGRTAAVLGKDHTYYAANLRNLAAFYARVDQNYEQAIILLQEAKPIYLKLYGKNSALYTELLNVEGSLKAIQGKVNEGVALIKENADYQFLQFQKSFPYLSEKEQTNYYNLFKPIYHSIPMVAMYYKDAHPEVFGEALNNVLMSKAILFRSSRNLHKAIAGNKDNKTIELFEEWKQARRQLAVAYSMQETEQEGKDTTIRFLESKTEELEKRLSEKSTEFKTSFKTTLPSWEQVRKQLKPGEAVLEIFRLEDYKALEYQDAGSPLPAYYLAFILTLDKPQPQMIVLGEANVLEGRNYKNYINSIRHKLEDTVSWMVYWKPLDQLLSSYKRIWYCPDGVYHQISLSTLRDSSATYLLDKTEIRILSSSLELLDTPSGKYSGQNAFLLGYPDYKSKVTQSKTTTDTASSYQRSSIPEISDRERMELSELPGTKKEVTEIGTLMTTVKWHPDIVTGVQATENSVKQVHQKRVVHIATHGFFRSDKETEKLHPLMRSGLMLAGAASPLPINISTNQEDGILTAYEVQELQLETTELVVLSACETGKGELVNGEGIYGLQRAFRVAGARYLMISLWKVNDEATSQLMKSFYSFWLNGSDIETSFTQARTEVRKQFPEPYYWGAFVLVGR